MKNKKIIYIFMFFFLFILTLPTYCAKGDTSGASDAIDYDKGNATWTSMDLNAGYYTSEQRYMNQDANYKTHYYTAAKFAWSKKTGGIWLYGLRNEFEKMCLSRSKEIERA